MPCGVERPALSPRMVQVPVAVGAGGGVAVGRVGVKAAVGDDAATGEATLVVDAAAGDAVGATKPAAGGVVPDGALVGETAAGKEADVPMPMRVGEVPLR